MISFMDGYRKYLKYTPSSPFSSEPLLSYACKYTEILADLYFSAICINRQYHKNLSNHQYKCFTATESKYSMVDNAPNKMGLDIIMRYFINLSKNPVEDRNSPICPLSHIRA